MISVINRREKSMLSVIIPAYDEIEVLEIGAVRTGKALDSAA